MTRSSFIRPARPLAGALLGVGILLGAAGSTGALAVPAVAQEAGHGHSHGALDQHVSASETIVPHGTPAVMSAGHADMGAVFDVDGEGTMTLLVRDDSGDQPQWRYLDDVVFRVGAAAAQTLPDNSDYSFVGAKGGETVWVIPQTQITDVPWLGWNTQAPSLVEHATRGVTMRFDGHQGAGNFSLFLQNGGFDKPDVVFATTNTKKAEQTAFVDMNTHTHANWTFTQPGTHLVGITMTTTTKEGQEVSASGALRFAVGPDASVSDAQHATWNGPGAEGESKRNGTAYVLGTLVGIAALVGALVFMRRRARK